MIPVDDLKTMADTRSDLLELFPGAVDEAYSKKLWEKLVLACACTIILLILSSLDIRTLLAEKVQCKEGIASVVFVGVPAL